MPLLLLCKKHRGENLLSFWYGVENLSRKGGESYENIYNKVISKIKTIYFGLG